MNARYLAAVCCLVALPALADELKLPSRSPSAKVMQTVGLTDITIDYSSPAVKGRKIWGALVPYGQVWRAGANQATRITFSQDVMVGDTAVPAGTYSFHVQPTAKEWSLILNKTANQWGSYEYKKEADLLRYTAVPKPVANRERLTYTVSDFTDESASIDLEWEKLKVSLPVKLKTKEQVAANLKAATESAWQPMYQAARYSLDAKDFTNAATYVDKSIAIEEKWVNVWMKAQIMAGSGKYKEARELAEKAQSMGQKDSDFWAAEDVKKGLADWKNKS